MARATVGSPPLARMSFAISGARRLSRASTRIPSKPLVAMTYYAHSAGRAESPHALPTQVRANCLYALMTSSGGSSSVVERQLPKLDVAGSIPVSRSIRLRLQLQRCVTENSESGILHAPVRVGSIRTSDVHGVRSDAAPYRKANHGKRQRC